MAAIRDWEAEPFGALPRPALKLRCRLLQQAAEAIRSLNSQLRAIRYDKLHAGPALVYTFAPAGPAEVFEVVVEPLMESLADLYPAAASLAADLAQRCGVAFRQYEEVG